MTTFFLFLKLALRYANVFFWCDLVSFSFSFHKIWEFILEVSALFYYTMSKFHFHICFGVWKLRFGLKKEPFSPTLRSKFRWPFFLDQEQRKKVDTNFKCSSYLKNFNQQRTSPHSIKRNVGIHPSTIFHDWWIKFSFSKSIFNVVYSRIGHMWQHHVGCWFDCTIYLGILQVSIIFTFSLSSRYNTGYKSTWILLMIQLVCKLLNGILSLVAVLGYKLCISLTKIFDDLISLQKNKNRNIKTSRSK